MKERYIEEVNDKTFTNSSKSKILKCSLLIKDENMIRHRRTFKYSISVIIKIDRFNWLWYSYWSCWTQHPLHYFLSHFEKEMHFVSIDKNEKIRLQEIAMTLSMIYDLTFVTFSASRMSQKLLFEWNELRYFAIEWSLLSHKMQIEWWIINLQKNTKRFRKLVKISTRTKEL